MLSCNLMPKQHIFCVAFEDSAPMLVAWRVPFPSDYVVSELFLPSTQNLNVSLDDLKVIQKTLSSKTFIVSFGKYVEQFLGNLCSFSFSSKIIHIHSQSRIILYLVFVARWMDL